MYFSVWLTVGVMLLCTSVLHSSLKLITGRQSFLLAAARNLGSSPNTCTGTTLDEASRHLVVLSHGLMGTAKDLTYLAAKLRQRGFTVLTSQSNELFRSYLGIAQGAQRLADEVYATKRQNPSLERVSFVGNSLGGLYVRYAVGLLHNQSDQSIAGLQPAQFLTIATPHLGVRDHTFLEDFQSLPKLDFVRKLVALTMFRTGQDLFYTTHDDRDQSILYEMATQPKFIQALQSFQQRRLYANLKNDFLVPLGTAAFLTEREVGDARAKYCHRAGIVGRKMVSSNDTGIDEINTTPEQRVQQQMIASLNSVGWEKVFVHFPGLLPNAHNKICALRKYTQTIDAMFGFEEGQFVMDEASEWFQP